MKMRRRKKRKKSKEKLDQKKKGDRTDAGKRRAGRNRRRTERKRQRRLGGERADQELAAGQDRLPHRYRRLARRKRQGDRLDQPEHRVRRTAGAAVAAFGHAGEDRADP